MAARGERLASLPVGSRSGAGLLHRGEFEAQARDLILTRLSEAGCGGSGRVGTGRGAATGAASSLEHGAKSSARLADDERIPIDACARGRS